MKLHELYEDLRKFVSNKDTRHTLGQGREALTYTKGNKDTERVYKVSSHTSGNSIFLHALAQQPSLQQNPYFPKVHATRTSSTDRVAIVERLDPMTSVMSFDTIRQIYSTLYGSEAGHIVQPSTKVGPALQIREALEAIAENIFWFLAWNESMRTDLKFVDPDIIAAGNSLRHICKTTSTPDLRVVVDHGNIDNLMIRRSGGKLQLVISDPLTTK